MNTPFSSRIAFVTQILLLTALAGPLISKGDFLYPFGAPPVFWFEIFVALAVLCYAILLVLDSSYRPPLNYLTLGLTGFFVIQFLLLIHSTDPWRSFQGSAERLTGVWNLFHYYLFFIVALALAQKDAAFIKRLVYVLLVVSIVAGIQYFLLELNPNISYARYAFGNPGFLANFMALQIPIIFWYFPPLLKSREDKIGFILLIGFFTIVIPSTGNRASALALIAELFFIGGYFLLKLKRGKILLAAILLLCLSGYTILYLNRNADFVKNRFYLWKFTSWSPKEDRNILNRFILWDMAWKGFLERPIGGWGRENFERIYEKYYNPRFYWSTSSEPWGDRAHNVFLDELSSGGIINILAWATLLWLFIKGLLRIRRISPDWETIVIPFSAFFIGYAIQGFFTLDTNATYIPLFMAFTLVAFIVFQKTNVDATVEPSIHIIKSSAILFLLIFIALEVFFTIPLMLANYHVGKAVAASPRNLPEFVSRNKKLDAVMNDTNPYKAEMFIVEGYEVRRYYQFPAFAGSVLKKMNEISKTNRNLHQKFHVFRGMMMTVFLNSAKIKNLEEEAKALWASLLRTNPFRQHYYMFAADFYQVVKEYGNAVALIRKAMEFTESKGIMYMSIGNLEKDRGRKEEAKKAYIETLKDDYRPYPKDAIKIGVFLAQFSDPEALEASLDFFLSAEKQSKNDPYLYASLAYVYGKLGNQQEADKASKKAYEVATGNEKKKDIEKIINNLPEAVTFEKEEPLTLRGRSQ